MDDNDRRVLTDRVGRSFDRADSAPQRRDGTPAFAGQVYDGGAMPDAVPRWYLTHPVEFDGTECEACSYTPSADTQASVPVIVLHHVPSVGDILIAELIGGRWVAEEGAGGAHGCTCMTTICVTGCPAGSELVGATVTVKRGATTIATCTTADDGHGDACCSVCLDAGGGAGSYSVAVTATGYKDYSGTKSLACDGTTTIQLSVATDPASLRFTVTGCCNAALPGATVSLSDGQSCTTDASGQCSFWVGGGGSPITWTVSASPYFAGQTGDVVLPACESTTQDIAVTLLPASGYACGPTDQNTNRLPYAIPTTLDATDSVYGAFTLTWDPANSWWYGTLTGSFAANCDCPSQSFTIEYYMFECGTQVSDLTFRIVWSAGDYGECTFGTFSVVRRSCPYGGATTTCAGGGDYIYQTATLSTQLLFSTGPAWTVSSSEPFDATVTISAMPPCPTQPGNYPNLPWSSGGTVTITG